MKELKMYKHKEKGKLITFCGLDGCGKTTMMNKLIDDLKGDFDIFTTKQPTSAVRDSDIFRTYMDSSNHDNYDYRSLSLLAASDRVQHSNKVILPQLQDGKIVLSDRYYFSCLSNLRARGYTKDKWIYEIAQSVIKPDISFFFDVPVEIAVERVRTRPEEKDRFIDMELQYKLRREYIDICKANKGILVPTNTSMEDTYSVVLSAVKSMLGAKNER